MLPALGDGTPLCLERRFAKQPLAWPKLWKHHGAKTQTDRINDVSRRRKESFLKRYGGIIGLEWFFPKILETLEKAPDVYQATEIWLEAGDWYVWQLVGGEAADLPRSTCQAGYKAMWSKADGYPSSAFFRALNPAMAKVVQDKMPGRMVAPGEAGWGFVCGDGSKNGIAGRHSGQCGDHRCTRRSAGSGSCESRHPGDGTGDQQLSHAERRRGQFRTRCSGHRRRWYPAGLFRL